jgi:hypothetical protein
MPQAVNRLYSLFMARGWESKSVEDQIGEAEAERDLLATPYLSPADRERQERIKSLQLSRAQIVSRLEVARNARYRSQLEQALEHLDKQLRECESGSKQP